MKTDCMFDENLMDSFRADNPSNEVLDAWYIFCLKLLPLVNEYWFRLMKSNNVVQKPGLYDHTSLSDEVLVHWVILCKIDKLKEAKAKNWPSKDKNIKGKKKGPHDSREKGICTSKNTTKLMLHLNLIKK